MHQKINHFPGMINIYRKNHLARNLNKLWKVFPEEFDFYPKTWLLPLEHKDFEANFKSKMKKQKYKTLRKRRDKFMSLIVSNQLKKLKSRKRNYLL